MERRSLLSTSASQPRSVLHLSLQTEIISVRKRGLNVIPVYLSRRYREQELTELEVFVLYHVRCDRKYHSSNFHLVGCLAF